MLVDHLSHPDMDDVFRPRSTFLRKNYLEVSQRGAAQIRYPYAYVAPSTRASRPGSTVFAHRKLSIVGQRGVERLVDESIGELVVLAPDSRVGHPREPASEPAGLGTHPRRRLPLEGTSYATIRIGVPGATKRRIRRMSRFETRTHPCDTARPSSHGAYVPWIPTIPPPGQSESREYALVSNANRPSTAAVGTNLHVT